jgi:hypothetical protein
VCFHVAGRDVAVHMQECHHGWGKVSTEGRI